MKSETKAANAMGGKTARACDSCLLKRARWFCAADDAFLCQSCDASVHSANQLASRHERVRLQTPSFKFGCGDDSTPAWHRGFTRKARTPRHNKSISASAKEDDEKISINNNPLPFVPELSNEETSTPYDDDDDSEEQLLYRVPIFDPFSAELCNEVGNSRTETTSTERNNQHCRQVENMMGEGDHEDGTVSTELDHLYGFLPSDIELAEFAADVESLLGRGADEDSCCDIKGLEMLDCKEEGELDVCGAGDHRRVKVEEEEENDDDDDGEEMEGILACQVNPCLDWNFGYESSPVAAAEDETVVSMAMETKIVNNEEGYKEQTKKDIFLRLNYEAVITAWDGQASPWTTGIRPEVNPSNGWPDFMGFGPIDLHHPHGGLRGHGGGGAGSDGGREARVSRYREKRRTRLFSKKIRYEVRKLNAEKRPRMKGRFVKRTSFMGINGFPYIPKVVNK